MLNNTKIYLLSAIFFFGCFECLVKVIGLNIFSQSFIFNISDI